MTRYAKDPHQSVRITQVIEMEGKTNTKTTLGSGKLKTLCGGNGYFLGEQKNGLASWHKQGGNDHRESRKEWATHPQVTQAVRK